MGENVEPAAGQRHPGGFGGSGCEPGPRLLRVSRAPLGPRGHLDPPQAVPEHRLRSVVALSQGQRAGELAAASSSLLGLTFMDMHLLQSLA